MPLTFSPTRKPSGLYWKVVTVPSGAGDRHQLVQVVVGVGGRAAGIGDGGQVAVGVVGVGGRADLGDLVVGVAGVAGRRAVVDDLRAVAGRVVDVGDGCAAGQRHLRQLAGGVVAVGGDVAAGVGHARHFVQHVVGVGERGIDRGSAGVVDLAGQVAGRVVGVGRVGAVAVELLLQLAEVVVRVLDDQVARAVGQLGQPAQGVVAVVDRVAALIDALGALALGVVGEVSDRPLG